MARGTPIETIIDSFEELGHAGLVALDVGLARATIEKRLKDEKGFFWEKGNPPWTPRDTARVRRHYAGMAGDGESVAKLAADMGRSHGSVVQQAALLGVTLAATKGPLLLAEDGIDVSHHGPFVLTNFTASGEDPIRLTVHGTPVPWARAGEKGGVHFVSGPTKVAKDRLSARFATLPRLTGNVAISLVFWLDHHRAVDVDNLEKLVLDAGNDAKLWRDDSQATFIVKWASYSADDPRTEIEFQVYDEALLKRGRDHWPRCEWCHEPFHPKQRKTQPRACSKECEADLVRETQGVLL